MWLNFVIIIGFFVAFMFFLYLFIADVITVAINGVIIYLIGLRVYTEINKHKKLTEEYLVGCIISALLVALIGKLFPFWQVTTFIILAFFATKTLHLIKN